MTPAEKAAREWSRAPVGVGLNADCNAFITGWRAATERAANVVQTNWCDPLMTGPGGIGSPPYSPATIERLLRNIAAAIREGRK